MLTWAEKDTRGRIYDPEYFNINEVNRRLPYALESDQETAVRMFMEQGVTGVVDWDGTGPTISANGKIYFWEWLGDMLLKLGDTSKIKPSEGHFGGLDYF